jgi:two-component system chemotaxis sensor kinase CheA
MSGAASSETLLRVKASKVTLLLDLVGELGLAALAVTHHPALAELDLAGFEAATHRLELLVHEVQDLTSSLRLVPVDELFRQMQRVVRDLSHETGKPIELVLDGEDTEIDKVVVDELKDALIHLVRNAADHGLESPAARVAAGKPEQGRITLTAAQQGQEIHITVADDGRGLKRADILQRARDLGLIGAAEEPDDATVWHCIFKAGFSTATEVSNLSGRGVGMDVVRNIVQSLRGRIALDTQPGEGMRVTLIIPLTLAFLESMVVRSRQRLYAIPIEVVNEVFRPEAAEIVRASADGSELVRRQGSLVPVGHLPDEYDAVDPIGNRIEAALVDQVIVVVQTSKGAFGLPVDEIVGEQQVVMKPLQGQLRGIRGGAGCALLSSGEIAIALDVESLRQELRSERHAARDSNRVF